MGGVRMTAVRYRTPSVSEYVDVSLDQFDIDDIREYVAHVDAKAGTGPSGDSLTISREDLGRVETLALCGQTDAARETVLEIVSRHIGRKL
jgi:hypothetical protein